MKLLKVENGKIKLDVNTEAKLLSYERQKAEMEAVEKQLKKELEEYLTSNDKTSAEISDNISCYFKKGGTRKGLDQTKLKEEEPIIYNKYLKETKVKDSVVLQFEVE